MNWYLRCVNKFADFSGRACRSEFWYFVLINNLIVLGSLMLGAIIHEAVFGLGVLYALVMMVPSLAVGSRRLHDTGRSGWLQLIAYIPFVGMIGSVVLLIFFAQDSSFGRNQYGPNPKHPATV